MSEQLTDNLRVFVVPLQVMEDESLSSSEKMVYIVLRSFVNPHKAEAFPAVPTIARLASLSERQVQRVMKSLEEKGYIAREAQYKYDPNKRIARQTANLYKLALPKSEENTGATPCHRGGDTMSPGGATPCHRGGDTMSPDREHNHLNNQIINNDDDTRQTIESIYEQYKTEITREQFDQVVKRVSKRKTPNFAAYLNVSVQNEISNAQVAATDAAEESKVKKGKGQSKRKQQMEVVQSQDEEEVSKDELEEMRKLALKLDSSR
ncbi:helix-turn-helix domain-containing protein [Paenibacillus sp. GCM10027626]|uniref:helix-turn-helix domain-containing protein n=1 Tax=Paenibacillus sp. GCM10027626 TaxID=3273411 RepID=UPI00363FC9F9